MEHEPRKLFVGGLPRHGVTRDDLRVHFARYGNVVDALVLWNPETGVGRGFGFVEFDDEAALERALDPAEKDRHVFGGRKVDIKRAEARLKRTQPTSFKKDRALGCNPNADSKKIFVGGLPNTTTVNDLTAYFERFGMITDAVVMTDKVTGRPRGFGFVTFDSKSATEKVLDNDPFHDLNGARVETKPAISREQGQCQNGWHYDSIATGSPASYYPYVTPTVYYVPDYMSNTYQYIYGPYKFVAPHDSSNLL